MNRLSTNRSAEGIAKLEHALALNPNLADARALKIAGSSQILSLAKLLMTIDSAGGWPQPTMSVGLRGAQY